MEVPRLPIHLIDEIITMSVKTDHKEKSKNMHQQLSCKFQFPVEYTECQCCGNHFPTTLPLFMHLKFIGDIDFEPNPIKGSNFSKITNDYEELYMSYIPDYADEEDYSDDDTVVEGFIDGLSHNCSHV